MTDLETCDCELCEKTRQVLNRHGIHRRQERQLVRDLVETQVALSDVLEEAEEAGIDLESEKVEAILDEIFDDEKPTLN